MATFLKKESTILSIAIVVALAAITSGPLEASVTLEAVPEQSTAPASFPSPASVPSNRIVRIDGSSSMDKVNEALKRGFEKQYPGAKVEITRRGSDLALQSLLAGKIDLAAIGRPLTPQEKAQGLVLVPVAREKIAIVVGPDSAFKGGLTFVQFAQMFRGQITNWSQVGGPSAAIRFIDRPDGSDTRRIFQSYKIFQNVPFNTGANAQKIGWGSTEEVIKNLGKNGISYAIAGQVLNRKDVRVVPMHGVLPDQPQYPFSQPLSYVYKGPKPKPAVAEYLGFTLAPPNEAVIEQAVLGKIVAPKTTAAANTQADPQGDVKTASREQTPSLWWLWLLTIPLVGALLWWLLKDRTEKTPPSVNAIAVAEPTLANSRLFLVPYNGKNAYAYWQIVPGEMEALQRQGGEKLVLRLYDVTGIPDSELDKLYFIQQFRFQAKQEYLLLSIPADERDYIVEMGYLTRTGGWLLLARSASVRVAKSLPTSSIVTTETTNKNGNGETGWLTQTASNGVTWHAGEYHSPAVFNSHLYLVPYEGKNAYAYWQIAPGEMEALQRQGGEKLVLRLYDVTGIPDSDLYLSQNLMEIDCDLQQQYSLITLPAENRDYAIELGFITRTGSWLSLVRSAAVRVAAYIPAGSAVMVLVLRDGKNFYPYWEVPSALEALKRNRG